MSISCFNKISKKEENVHRSFLQVFYKRRIMSLGHSDIFSKKRRKMSHGHSDKISKKGGKCPDVNLTSFQIRRKMS
jgi:hypothetical protein